jgi:hypothetical protein
LVFCDGGAASVVVAFKKSKKCVLKKDLFRPLRDANTHENESQVKPTASLVIKNVDSFYYVCRGIIDAALQQIFARSKPNYLAKICGAATC